jgi:hypothetical protein
LEGVDDDDVGALEDDRDDLRRRVLEVAACGEVAR